MRRTYVLTPFALLFALALHIACSEAPAPEAAPAAEAAPAGRLEKVADGVWFRLGERDQGHCNNAVIELSDGLLVVDANFPSGAKLVMEDVKTVSDKPVKWVFDTHHHGDHAYGNALWTRAGATTLAYVGVAQEIGRYEPGRWQEASKTRPDVAEVGLDTLEPPKETFSETPHILEDPLRRVEFHHFGWAHTRGDGFVYLPAEKILATGDAVVNGAFNYTGDGNTGNWPNVVAGAMALDVEHVLPGHGPRGGKEVLEGQKAFFDFVNKAVGEAFDAGKKMDEVVTVADGKGKSTTIEPPAEVRNWVGDGFPEQVRVRWTELAEGKPHGAILGGE